MRKYIVLRRYLFYFKKCSFYPRYEFNFKRTSIIRLYAFLHSTELLMNWKKYDFRYFFTRGFLKRQKKSIKFFILKWILYVQHWKVHWESDVGEKIDINNPNSYFENGFFSFFKIRYIPIFNFFLLSMIDYNLTKSK